MKLKTRLLLASTVTVLLVLAVSEWLSYQHTATFLRQHESQMRSERDPAALLNTLRVERRHLLTSLASLHLIHAAVTVLALAIVLNILWYRLFIRRLEVLLRNINAMRLGTWSGTMPVEREDEIGQLSRAFNDLGAQLTLTVQQFAAASKLSAMALLGHGLVRKIVLLKDHLEAVTGMLDLAKEERREIPEPVLDNLKSMICELKEIPAEFEADFARQLGQHSSPSTLVPRPPQPAKAAAEQPPPPRHGIQTAWNAK
jgi:HAMP domain-containing protein